MTIEVREEKETVDGRSQKYEQMTKLYEQEFTELDVAAVVITANTQKGLLLPK